MKDQTGADISVTKDGDGKWLEAHSDPVANLYTFSQCMCFSDVHSDGDMKLLVAHLGDGKRDMKLRVYKGTTMASENSLMDLPTGVVSFYMDLHQPRTPAIAVASGPNIYVYRNMRPYFRFTLPSLEINPIEEDLWHQAKEEKIDVAVLYEMIEELRSQGMPLTARSLKFLTLDPKEMDAFASIHKYAALKRQTVITCIGTMQKSMSEDDAISCLIIGTENQKILVLDPEAFTVIAEMSLPSVAVGLSINGLFDVEFRIIVSCRNGVIYTLKRGMAAVEKGLELNSQPITMARLGKNIIVGCMDNTLRSYTTKGKKMWTIQLKSDITAMTVMDYKAKSLKAVVVATADNTVSIYKDKFLVNQIATGDRIKALLFGRFGREEGSLIMVSQGGALTVKLLRRTATFDEKDAQRGPPPGQNMRLDVPKKTKLYVDHTLRERDQAVVMHRQFMHDLQRLRLNTARSYAESLVKGDNPISSGGSSGDQLKLNATVTGIGPTFKLSVKLQNVSQSTPSVDMIITFSYDDKLYTVRQKYIQCPMLVPGVTYTFDTLVDCTTDKGISDVIKVFVLKRGSSAPTISANISMPVSEAAIIV